MHDIGAVSLGGGGVQGFRLKSRDFCQPVQGLALSRLASMREREGEGREGGREGEGGKGREKATSLLHACMYCKYYTTKEVLLNIIKNEPFYITA